MKFKVSDMLLSALSLLSCVGCSVKESREVCPCQLFLDFSEVDTASVKSIDIYVREDEEIILSDSVGKEESQPGPKPTHPPKDHYDNYCIHQGKCIQSAKE